MTDVLIALLGLAAGYGLHIAWVKWRKRRTSKSPIYGIADDLESFFEKSAHPSDLLSHPRFKDGIYLLQTDEYSTDDLIAYAKGSNSLIACMAAETLSLRTEGDPTTPLLDHFNSVYGTPERFFLLRTFEHRGGEQIIGRVIKVLDDTWEGEDEPLLMHFIRQRLAAGEKPQLVGFDSSDEDDLTWVRKFLERVDTECKTELAAGFESWGKSKLDTAFLNSCGRILTDEDERGAAVIIESVDLLQRVEAATESLAGDPPRSVLLVGDPGTGKSTALRVLTRRLRADGWTVFEASGTGLLAGQMYFGQLEERLQRLLRSLADRPKMLWSAPGIHEFLYLGKHRHSETSILDTILPAVEAGKIRLIGEIDPSAYERVVREKPRVKTAFETITVPRASDSATIDLATEWASAVTPDGSPPLVSRATLIESFKLVRQFFLDQANPGVLLEFLDRARELHEGKGDTAPDATAVLHLDDLTEALHRMTGLPATIIDDRISLSISDLRAFFQAHVKGQTEAVECLVERVAMIKAGLTDPTRPQGVFLFTGPTGTGKTEIAKTLADYLFGSPDRMIRLDMSEFQTAESQSRILGDTEGSSEHSALVNQIRRQPFSVILLDEFEKAHERAWDLFLQVFDDGRLTDRRGNTADFRHAIIIMTANVGAIDQGAAIGFGTRTGVLPVSQHDERQLTEVFRKEFLNRIDRIVTFRPLNRQIMREVLQKELDLVLERRGLRNRRWAVEWDPSAQDFLLDRGFSSAFGARPLKRAIERYLLSPLAMTIVNHRVPDGEQFLFVRSDGRAIQVEFIDPDAPDVAEAPSEADSLRETTPAAATLGQLTLDSHGSVAEVAALTEALARLRGTVGAEAWQGRKHRLLDALSEPDFWQSNDRFAVLGEAEYMDRIDAGVKTAESLLRRLEGSSPGTRERFPVQLVHRSAHQLFLVHEATEGFEAGEAQDAFLAVEATRDSRTDPNTNDQYARRIAQMYREWATNRRMSLDVLADTPRDAGTPYRFVAAVSGFAAWRLLREEAGLHVFETPEAKNDTARAHDKPRHKVRVVVARQSPIPLDERADFVAAADDALDSEAGDRAHIVRRYREKPSPLVRDNVRGWRTGRIDRVLGGEFDLFGR